MLHSLEVWLGVLLGLSICILIAAYVKDSSIFMEPFDSNTDYCELLKSSAALNLTPQVRRALDAGCLTQKQSQCSVMTSDRRAFQLPFPLFYGDKTPTGMATTSTCFFSNSNACAASPLTTLNVASSSRESNGCKVSFQENVSHDALQRYVDSVSAAHCRVEFEPARFYRPSDMQPRTLETTVAMAESTNACTRLFYELDDMRTNSSNPALPVLFFVASKKLPRPEPVGVAPSGSPLEVSTFESSFFANALKDATAKVWPSYVRLRCMSGATMLAEFDFMHRHPDATGLEWFYKTRLVRMRFRDTRDPVGVEAIENLMKDLRVEFEDPTKTLYGISTKGLYFLKVESNLRARVATSSTPRDPAFLTNATHYVLFVGYRVDPQSISQVPDYVLSGRSAKTWGVQMNGNTVQLVVDEITNSSIPHVGKFVLAAPVESAALSYTARDLVDRFGGEFPTQNFWLGRDSMLSIQLKAIVVPQSTRVTLVGKQIISGSQVTDVFAIIERNDQDANALIARANLRWRDVYFTSLRIERHVPPPPEQPRPGQPAPQQNQQLSSGTAPAPAHVLTATNLPFVDDASLRIFLDMAVPQFSTMGRWFVVNLADTAQNFQVVNPNNNHQVALGYLDIRTNDSTYLLGPASSVWNINVDHTFEILCTPVFASANAVPNSTLVHFLDNRNSTRMILAHLPWSDGNVYYDVRGCCGADTRTVVRPAASLHQRTVHYVFRATATARHIFENARSIVANNTRTSTSYAWGGRSEMFNPWKGRVYFVRLYNRALTDAEITRNYEDAKRKYKL